MKQLCIVLFGMFPTLGAAESSVVTGRAIRHFPIEAAIPCPPDHICMDAWIGWVIDVKATLAGPAIKGRVRAARIQHAEFVSSYLRQFTLFVLTPIDEPENRELLGADYLLSEASQARTMHCFNRSPETYGSDDYVRALQGGDQASRDSYCFQLQEGQRQ